MWLMCYFFIALYGLCVVKVFSGGMDMNSHALLKNSSLFIAYMGCSWWSCAFLRVVYCFLFSVKQKDKWVLFLSWSAGYDACHRLYCNEYVHFGYAFLCKKNRILLCGKPLGRILNTSEFRKNTVINNEGLFNVS